MSLTPEPFSSDIPEEPQIGEEAESDSSSSQTVEPTPTENVEGASTPMLRTPVEAEYETNGGPLGCCLGTVAGVFLTALLITLMSISFSNGAILGAATLPVLLAGAAICGYIGWRIGKRVYREYELSPRQKRKLAQLEKKYGPK